MDARPVISPDGAAAYLSKYFTKQMTERDGLERLGFSRRWSASRNWPAPQKMQFAVTRSQGWQGHHWFKQSSPIADQLKAEARNVSLHPYAIKVGENLAIKYEKRNTKRRQQSLQRRLSK